MSKILNTGLAAIFGAAIGVVSVPATPAYAQGFFGSLFGAPSYREDGYRDSRRARQDQRRRYQEQRRNGSSWSNGWFERRAPRPAPPRVTVSPPKYFTYKADALKTVSFESLGRSQIASADDNETVSLLSTPFAAARPDLAEVSLRLLPEIGAAVETRYAEHPGFIWIDAGRPNDSARDAMKALARAADYGLDPADYAVASPSGFDEDARRRDLARFELELTAKVLTYVRDAKRGRIDPNRISEYHDFKLHSVDYAAVLDEIDASRDVAAVIEAANPSNAPFRALKAELARLRGEAAESTVPVVARNVLIRPGMSHVEIPNIVGAVTALGSPGLKEAHAETLSTYAILPPGAARETYTPEIVALIKDFQKENGLGVDGVIGRNTVWAMTVESPETKIRKVRLAMERLRWLPRELGSRHVFINQPAYRANYVNAGRTALSMKVVVGKKSNQTNFFHDKIETVEFNPYWGVPRSIIVNEMIPKLYQDPSYLDRLGYEVTNVRGQRLSSSSVDWYAVATKQSSVDVRQPPGRSNALGSLKILFPNAHAIYMHDTPAKSLFNKPTRAYSHGCVRLEDPQAMAAAVLGKSVDYVNSRIAQGRNDEDKVNTNIPVYVSYFTAWPADDGRVGYFEDMYDRDDYLTKAIERNHDARRIAS